MFNSLIRKLYVDNVELNLGSGGKIIATLDVGGFQHELVVNEFSDGGGGVTVVSAANPFPTTDVAAEVSLASIDLKTTGTPTTVKNGKVTVTTAGTRVQLSASSVVKSVTIKAALANTGTIYVGDVTVSAANGLELAAGDSISASITNLNAFYIDSSTNAQSVTYLGVV